MIPELRGGSLIPAEHQLDAQWLPEAQQKVILYKLEDTRFVGSVELKPHMFSYRTKFNFLRKVILPQPVHLVVVDQVSSTLVRVVDMIMRVGVGLLLGFVLSWLVVMMLSFWGV